LRRRDWRRWSCPAGTKRRSPWKSGSSRWRRRRRSRTRPRDRCSRLGRCRLHDHLRNGHRAWRRRRRSRRRGTRSSRSGSRGRRGLHRTAFGLSVAGAWAGADSWDRARTDSSMVAGRSSESSRHTAAKLYGTQRMTHSGIGAMGLAKGRVDEKDSSRRKRLIAFERKLETYQPAIRECVGGPRWYSPMGDRCSVTCDWSGTASGEAAPRSSDTTIAAVERTAQLFACAQRTQCESCCGCSVGWSWSPPELAPAPWQMTDRASLAPASHGTGLPFASGIRSA
jgi:hypothetical protein